MSTPTQRPTVHVFLALSLDGFIAGPQGDLSWLEPHSTDSAADTGYERLMSEVDTLVMGRNTHDKVLTFGEWPYADKQVVVLTHRPFNALHGEAAMGGPLSEVLATLWAKGSRHVYLDGGQTVRQGLAEGLVDHLTLSWVPVMLGDGVPLFGGLERRLGWEAVEVRRLASGLVQTVYRAAAAG